MCLCIHNHSLCLESSLSFTFSVDFRSRFDQQKNTATHSLSQLCFFFCSQQLLLLSYSSFQNDGQGPLPDAHQLLAHVVADAAYAKRLLN